MHARAASGAGDQPATAELHTGDYDCEHGFMHGECWVVGCNHQAPDAKGRPWQEAPEWTI